MFFQRSIPAAPSPARPPSTHPQTQSLLLTRLPAELQNEIYTLVFTSPDPGPKSPTPTNHPLSLLRTCRKIHTSASLLAFTTHTFPLPPSLAPTPLSLRALTSHLPVPLLHALTSLCTPFTPSTPSLLATALLLLPSLRRFTITTSPTSTSRTQSCGHILPPRLRSARPAHAWTPFDEAAERALRAVDYYAPPWLVHALEEVVAGRAVRWQRGERWGVEWGQVRSEACYARVVWDEERGLAEELWMDGGDADGVGGVDMEGDGLGRCPRKGCAEVSWVGAQLVQEGGRTVGVRAVWCGEEEEVMGVRKTVPKVVLEPGTEPAEELVRAGAGMGFEADEEYWEAMRRRNGDLGALCRGWWKSAAVWRNAADTPNGDALQRPREG